MELSTARLKGMGREVEFSSRTMQRIRWELSEREISGEEPERSSMEEEVRPYLGHRVRRIVSPKGKRKRYGRLLQPETESHLEMAAVTGRTVRESRAQESRGMLFESSRHMAALRSLSLEPEELGDTAVIDTGMAFVKVCVCD